MVEDCGYSKDKVSKVFYKVPNLSNSDGLREVINDSTTFLLLNCAFEGGNLDMYVEHIVSDLAYNAVRCIAKELCVCVCRAGGGGGFE
uniref:Uncharacterized protein n=1 Tax=Nelumbo nucifera TaxID=4432 RepID=A0A822ZMA6_NELNU|nr:TPA_asm: hypothetical protein HUJ06_003840 [Nelumbo nucifera]